jgi:hypothetical protein
VQHTHTWHIAKEQLREVQLRRVLQQDVVVFCHGQVVEEAKCAILQACQKVCVSISNIRLCLAVKQASSQVRHRSE